MYRAARASPSGCGACCFAVAFVAIMLVWSVRILGGLKNFLFLQNRWKARFIRLLIARLLNLLAKTSNSQLLEG
jgi:hypothetical protein